jgi:hypothetical protein
MRGLSGVAGAGLLFVAAACSSSRPAPAAEGEPAFRTTATVKDIMDAVIDPNADVLWESVSTTINQQGTIEKMPRTDDEWQAVRRSAMTIVEATNLLVMDGRAIAPDGHKSEYPGIELEPAEMQKLVDADRTSWVKYAHGLHDKAMLALKAIDARSVQGLMDAGEGLDEACENCHKHYWYPEKKPS